MNLVRAVVVLVLVASCLAPDDNGVHYLGTLPPTGDGGTQETGGGTGTGGGTVGGGSGHTGGGVGTPDIPCNCQVAGLTLTMSWDCYRAHFNSERQPTATCGGFLDASLACDLTVISLYPPSQTVVRDGTGAAVGGQISSDTSDYVCPDDAALHAMTVRAGIFPDAGCSESACTCADGGLACP